MAAQPGLFAAGAAPTPAALKAAHAGLMADKSLQFTFAKQPAPTPPQPTPGWLKALGDFLSGLSNALGYVFWGVVALLVVALVAWIVLEIARTRWPERFRRRKPKPPPPVEEEWRPEATVARALLEEADRLAAAGDYAQAARLLLHRSIEHIEGHRPRLVRPAFTSREISLLDEIPASARPTFTAIAQVVERSLFGGRPVDAAGFAACRKAYEDFAFPEAWA